MVLRKKILAVLTGVAIFLSGGKISIILLFLIFLVLVFTYKEKARYLFVNFSKYIVVSFGLFSALVFISGIGEYIDTKKANLSKPAASNASSSILPRVGIPKNIIKNPIMMRYYSCLAGLWMTLDGGYGGTRYISSEGFAYLMMERNPWDINEKYGLTWDDWYEIGGPQNSYLRFGSAYGPSILCLLLAGFFCIGWLGLLNLSRGEDIGTAVFSIFFIVNIVFNQTQSWLQARSRILFFLGFCAAHILIVWLSNRYRMSSFLRPIEIHQKATL